MPVPVIYCIQYTYLSWVIGLFLIQIMQSRGISTPIIRDSAAVYVFIQIVRKHFD